MRQPTIADEELRRRLYAHVITKHRDLYWRRLPETLIAAQRSAGDLFRLSREHERLNVKTEAVLQNQAARLESAAAERESLEREVGELRAQLAERSGPARDHPALVAERDRLQAELGAWRERVSFMEGTRAWRLRNRLLRLRGRSLPAP